MIVRSSNHFHGGAGVSPPPTPPSPLPPLPPPAGLSEGRLRLVRRGVTQGSSAGPERGSGVVGETGGSVSDRSSPPPSARSPPAQTRGVTSTGRTSGCPSDADRGT